MARKGQSKRKRAAANLRAVAQGNADNRSNEKQKANPFEFRANKKAKNAVYGRRIKGSSRNLSVARSEANERRKQTLLLEYKNKNRANAFIDRRLGERDHGLSAEDKILMRFQRQRSKQLQKEDKYTINDEESDEEKETLTHMGQKVDGQFDFGDESRFSDSDDGDMDAEFTNAVNFGGGFQRVEQSNEDAPKTRREIMMDIIKDSKKRKVEKQRDREERDTAMSNLDADFEDINALLDFRGSKKNKKSDKKTLGDIPRYADFDIVAREMQVAAHDAAPTDKLKSASEIALKEKHNLEALERERLRRMNVTYDDENDENIMNTSDRPIGGDDLEASYEIDPEFLENGGLNHFFFLKYFSKIHESSDDAERIAQQEAEEEEAKEAAKNNTSDFDSDEDFERDAARIAGWSTDGIENKEDIEENLRKSKKRAKYEKEEARRKSKKLRAINGTMTKNVSIGPKIGGALAHAEAAAAAAEMPFTFEVPSKFEDLTKLLLQWGTTPELSEILIQRIRVCNSAHHGDGSNKEKLRIFLGFLLRYLMESFNSKDANSKTSKTKCNYIDSISKGCWHIVQEIPMEAQQLFTMHIARIQEEIGLTQKYPSSGSILLLRLIPAFFSSSDFRHPVVTPALLVMGQCLQQCTVASEYDVVAGLCIADIMLVATTDSRRYSPEVLNYLTAFFASIENIHKSIKQTNKTNSKNDMHSTKTKEKEAENRTDFLYQTQQKQAFSRSPIFVDSKLSLIHSECSDAPQGIFGSLLDVSYTKDSNEKPNEKKKNGIISIPPIVVICALQNVHQIVQTLRALTVFPEQIVTLRVILETFLKASLNNSLIKKCELVLKKIHTAIASSSLLRRPLQMQNKQVRSIKQYAPAFDEEFNPGRKKSFKEQKNAEVKSLKRKAKQERKSAIRELRRDNTFIGRARHEKYTKLKQKQTEKYNEVMHFLQEQQATFHQMVKQGNNVGGGSGGGGKKQKSRLTRTDGR